ncbi:MAG: hypothetical protein P4L64_08745 [Caulobacteraceae bacterium]|nr:hypothetical protein [Caulobacteraceae bacterium]
MASSGLSSLLGVSPSKGKDSASAGQNFPFGAATSAVASIATTALASTPYGMLASGVLDVLMSHQGSKSSSSASASAAQTAAYQTAGGASGASSGIVA